MATINGTSAKDRLHGTNDDDTLNGFAGDDEFFNSGGNDSYNGGAGVDTVIYGSLKPVPSMLKAPGVTVNLKLGYGFDRDGSLETYISIENVVGSSFNDKIWGSDGENTLEGGAGNDQLYGEGGRDRLYGGDGDDLLHGGYGGGSISGGSGNDTVSYDGLTQGVFVDLFNGLGDTGAYQLDLIDSVENITGTNHNDVLIGDAGSNILKGQGGGDRLAGRGGADALDGGAGSDWADYSNATSGLRADLVASQTNTGEADGDTYISIENLLGSNYNDVLLGDEGANLIDGGNGNDALYGRGGDDWFYGRGGSDTLNGEAGSDTFVFQHSVNNDAEQDVVWDFEVGVDHINLASSGIYYWNDLQDGSDGDYMEQVGNDVVIHTNNEDMVTLRNVQMSSLTNADLLLS